MSDSDETFQFNVPFFHNTHRFVPRPDLTSEIQAQLDGIRPRHCVLTGMGGIGKTEMALKICEYFKSRCHIFWIDCRSEEAMTKSYLSVGPLLDPTLTRPSTAEIRQQLGRQDNWMLIIDNVDDEAIFEYMKTTILPTSENGRILIAGRLTSLRTVKKPVDIPLLTVEEGKDLLKACCPTIVYAEEEADDFVRQLGQLPLAIEQAGNYMEIFSKPFEEYVSEYMAAATRTDLLNEPPASTYSRPLSLTWEITVDKIREEEKLVFNVLAFLRIDGVEESFLKQGAVSNPTRSSSTARHPNFERGVRLPDRLAAVLSTPAQLRSALNRLLRLSLLRKSGKKYTMHVVGPVYIPF